jgi:hypothetical protein
MTGHLSRITRFFSRRMPIPIWTREIPGVSGTSYSNPDAGFSESERLLSAVFVKKYCGSEPFWA